MSKVGVRIIHGNIEILSEFSKSEGAYYTWGRIIHGNLRYCFLDGAALQYKNFKNLCNLLTLEWHFFATNHGKNACDGVSGTVKQEASKVSLQATVVGHILTAKNLYDWGAGHLLNITLFFISKDEVSAHVDQQERRLSGDEPSFETVLLTAPNEGDPTVGCTPIGPGLPTATTSISWKQCEIVRYVGCRYDVK